MDNLITLWPNLARACEIAMLGDLTITVIFDQQYTNGFEDYENIKLFYKDVKFGANGHITVRISEPNYLAKKSNETLFDILDRVNAAKNNKRPKDFINDSCDRLFKSAIEKFSLSLSKQRHIIEISQVIEQLHNSGFIRIEALAEAIHYNCYTGDAFCNAEDRYISFGDGITISNAQLNKTDINNAINHLKSLI